MEKRDMQHSWPLVQVAQGEEKADTVITGASILNVNTREILEKKDVAIKNGYIAFVGDGRHTVGKETTIIEARGLLLCPGFMDAHLHVESSMVTVTQFAQGVLPHGTTTIFMDPHEMANVMGLEGVKRMVEEGKHLPLTVFATVPSCVPAAPAFEDTRFSFGPEEIEEAFLMENIAGLGEMMNFSGVLHGDPPVVELLEVAKRFQKPITGHYASPDLIGLQAYIAAGIFSCHEATTKEEALARMRLGMYTKMREGSAWQDVKETIRAITEEGIDSRYGILVSDDVHPNTLVEKGHMDYILRKAIGEGLDPLAAVQMVTINPAQCFGMDRFLGSIAPGRQADILFLSNLEEVAVERVMARGEMVAQGGELIQPLQPVSYPPSFYHTVKTGVTLNPSHFQLPFPEGGERVLAHIIEVQGGKARTKHSTRKMKVREGRLERDTDVNLLMVMERHQETASHALGLVKGFSLRSGATASTIAHDSHNLMVLGDSREDMALSANILIQRGGGMVVVEKGQILAFVPLPIAGLISPEAVTTVSRQVKELEEAWKRLGCTLPSPFMSMSLLSLPVIPELRLTNRGLVDTEKGEVIQLLERGGRG